MSGSLPRLAVVMTDYDVVSKLGSLLGVSVQTHNVRQPHHRTPYGVVLKGSRAAALLETLTPLFGERRRSKALEVLSRYKAHLDGVAAAREADNKELTAHWEQVKNTTSFRQFCRSKGIARRWAKLRLTQSTLKLVNSSSTPEFGSFDALSSEEKLAWLAGLLEGEGSFVSRGVRLFVSVEMTDLDVVARVARLFSRPMHKQSPRKSNWSTSWRTATQGPRAYMLCKQILPWMGQRRSAKIEEALRARDAHAESLGQSSGAHLSPVSALSRKFSDTELIELWRSRTSGSLSSVARQLGVHPQSLKDELVRLNVYTAPVPKCRQIVSYVCAHCEESFLRSAARVHRYCSRSCSMLGNRSASLNF